MFCYLVTFIIANTSKFPVRSIRDMVPVLDSFEAPTTTLAVEFLMRSEGISKIVTTVL
jgi:hypothetical protein